MCTCDVVRTVDFISNGQRSNRWLDLTWNWLYARLDYCNLQQQGEDRSKQSMASHALHSQPASRPYPSNSSSFAILQLSGIVCSPLFGTLAFYGTSIQNLLVIFAAGVIATINY